jgi:hypothetical protein
MLRMLLETLVKLVVLFGLVFACFGFNYTRVLLKLLLPGNQVHMKGHLYGVRKSMGER